MTSAAEHWDSAYDHGDTSRSWYQAHAPDSLEMIEAAGGSPSDSLIDVGGGASTLVDDLLAQRWQDITILDVSATGLAVAQRRLGAAAQQVTWLTADLLTWAPERSYRIWHDRAVLHFLVGADQRVRYRAALQAATEPGAVAVFATFAPGGPQQCSGLPVRQYSAADLAEFLGPQWRVEQSRMHEHVTPAGARQPFTWASLRRVGFPSD